MRGINRRDPTDNLRPTLRKAYLYSQPAHRCIAQVPYDAATGSVYSSIEKRGGAHPAKKENRPPQTVLHGSGGDTEVHLLREELARLKGDLKRSDEKNTFLRQQVISLQGMVVNQNGSEESPIEDPLGQAGENVSLKFELIKVQNEYADQKKEWTAKIQALEEDLRKQDHREDGQKDEQHCTTTTLGIEERDTSSSFLNHTLQLGGHQRPDFPTTPTPQPPPLAMPTNTSNSGFLATGGAPFGEPYSPGSTRRTPRHSDAAAAGSGAAMNNRPYLRRQGSGYVDRAHEGNRQQHLSPRSAHTSCSGVIHLHNHKPNRPFDEQSNVNSTNKNFNQTNHLLLPAGVGQVTNKYSLLGHGRDSPSGRSRYDNNNNNNNTTYHALDARSHSGTSPLDAGAVVGGLSLFPATPCRPSFRDYSSGSVCDYGREPDYGREADYYNRESDDGAHPPPPPRPPPLPQAPIVSGDHGVVSEWTQLPTLLSTVGDAASSYAHHRGGCPGSPHYREARDGCTGYPEKERREDIYGRRPTTTTPPPTVINAMTTRGGVSSTNVIGWCDSIPPTQYNPSIPPTKYSPSIPPTQYNPSIPATRLGGRGPRTRHDGASVPTTRFNGAGADNSTSFQVPPTICDTPSLARSSTVPFGPVKGDHLHPAAHDTHGYAGNNTTLMRSFNTAACALQEDGASSSSVTRALIIGIDYCTSFPTNDGEEYPFTTNPGLNACNSDAQQWARFFQRIGKLGRDNIRVLGDSALMDHSPQSSSFASYTHIMSALDWVFDPKATTIKERFFIFCGLGMQQEAENFAGTKMCQQGMCPADVWETHQREHKEKNDNTSRYSKRSFKLLTDTDIHERLLKLPAGVFVTIITDSCHGGTPLERDGYDFLLPSVERGLEEEEELKQSPCKPRFLEVPNAVVPNVVDPSPRTKLRCSAIHWQACQDANDEYCVELPIEDCPRGVFSHFFVGALAKLGPHTSPEAILEVILDQTKRLQRQYRIKQTARITLGGTATMTQPFLQKPFTL